MGSGDAALLLVDDDVDCLTLLGLAIKRLPQRLQFATVQDGEEAMAYLRGEGQFSDRTLFPFPALILLDLKMPRMDGFEFLNWIRNEPAFSRIPVIVLTISTVDSDVWRAYQLGANSFISKGVEVSELAKQLRGVVDYWMGLARLPQQAEIRPGVIAPSEPSPKGRSRGGGKRA
jgi:CheY-like chemotaxis protein